LCNVSSIGLFLDSLKMKIFVLLNKANNYRDQCKSGYCEFAKLGYKDGGETSSLKQQQNIYK